MVTKCGQIERDDSKESWHSMLYIGVVSYFTPIALELLKQWSIMVGNQTNNGHISQSFGDGNPHYEVHGGVTLNPKIDLI